MGPLFVDWTAYRSAFERQATEILGQPVQVAGTADASLLPIPTLAFTDVVIGDDPADPMMTVGRFDLQVELFPLLQGEVRVTEMRLEDPVLRARVDESGGFDLFAGRSRVSVDPKRVVLDRVEILRGRILVLDDRRPAPLEVTGINASLEARALVGPYKFDGAAVIEGEPVLLRISTGERDSRGQMIIKASATPASRPVAITLDGVATVDDGRPAWTGEVRIDRVVPEGSEDVLPWSVVAKLDADPAQLLAKDLEFRYGPPDRPFSIDGAATVDLSGDPSFEAVLSARQIDLDRTLGAGPGAPVAFPEVLAALSETLQGLPRPPIRGRVGFDIPGIVVGGGLIQNVRLDILPTDDGWHVETLQAALPGSTELAATGDLATSPMLEFQGTVAVASDQPSTLIGWWLPERPRTALRSFEARGRVAASPEGLTVTDLAATLSESDLAGRISYAPGRGDRHGVVSVSLSAGELSVEQVGAVIELVGPTEGEGFSGTDIRVDLTADRLTAGDTVAEGLDVAGALVDGTLSIERFTVADLAGARLSASGQVTDLATAPDGSIQARIAAERLDGVAALVAALAPGSAAAEMLRTAAPVLVPATVEATISAARSGGGTDATVRLAGTAGGSTIDGTLEFDGRVDRWREARLDLETTIEGPNGVRLMRQLGFDVPQETSAGRGRLSASASGVPGDGLEVALDGSLGSTRVRAVGQAAFPTAGANRASLEVALASDDVGPILALSGNPMADILASTPVDLKAGATVKGAELVLADLTGIVDGEPVRGALQIDLAPAVPNVTGDLAIRSANLEALLELALGPGTLAMPIIESRSPWPEAPFGSAVLDGITTDVALSVASVPVSDALVLDDVSLLLRSSASGVGFDQISAGLAGGRVGGSLLIKQDLEGQAAISGTLGLDDARAEELVWERDGRPVVTGALGLDVDFTANGRTVAGVVSSLAGGGSFRLADGVIRHMNPQAFSAVIRAADAGQEMGDERIRALFLDNIDVGNLSYERIEATFTITSGVLRAPAIVVSTGEATTSGSAMVDLGTLTLTSDWQLAVARGDAEAGSPPQVGILFRGKLDDPDRAVDVTSFSSYLGIRAFERETQRVLAMQADILERELLSRSILRAREAEARRVRAAEEAEARRIAEEEAARRAAEELLQAPADSVPEGASISPEDSFAETIRRRLASPAPEQEESQPGDPLPPLLPGIDIEPPPGGIGQGPLDLLPPSTIQ